jgi:PAS domain S-box-containing protein
MSDVVRATNATEALPGRWARPSSASFVPIAVLLALLALAFWGVSPSLYYDPPWLIMLGNVLGVTAVSLLVAHVAQRNYRATGRVQVLLLGCGVLTFGIGGALAALVRGLPDGANLNVAIYNTGAVLGGAFHVAAAFFLLAGVSPEIDARRRSAWLILGYGGCGLFMAVLTTVYFRGLLPPFFVQGVGPTTLRQQVLGTADLLFLLSLFVFFGSYLRTREAFLYWYACALALTCISLSAFFVERSVGGAVGWVGRVSQYVGGAYFLVALLTAARTARRGGTSLDNVLTRSLSGAEERFRALAENSPDAIQRFDPELNLLYVNVAGQRLYGRPAAALVGKHVGQLGLPEPQARVLSDAVRRVFATGELSEVEIDLAAGEGERFLEARCVGERSAGGAVANVLMVTRDVTESRRLDAERRLSETKFAKAFHGNAAAMAITRLRDGVFIDVNDQWVSVNGFAREAVLGKASLALSIWRDPKEREQFADELMQHGMIRNRECRFVTAGGEEWTGLVWAQVSELQGEPIVISSTQDVTERQRAEHALEEANARLREADQRKNEFLGVLSHELRNPLAPIRNSLYILDHATPGGDQARRAQAVLARQVDQLTRLVDDLLDATRVSRGKIDLQCDRLELKELVRRTLEDYRPAFEQARVRLQLEADPIPVFVRADWNRLAQVVGNLLQNAVKFTPRDGRVTVAVSEDRVAGRAVVRVADTGIGMAPEMIGRLFQPFIQGDVSLDRSKGGLGLGLALVKGLVELHGGEVEAESPGPGRGSTFSVRLPLAPPADARPPAGPHARTRAGGRVLLIEDNPDSADSLRELLVLKGHRVEVAYDGPDGIAKARRFRPDLVLCDIGLPGMDGYEVARAFRADEELKDAFLVALSGYARSEDRQRTSEAGFDGHIAKPPRVQELEELLADAPFRSRRTGAER